MILLSKFLCLFFFFFFKETKIPTARTLPNCGYSYRITTSDSFLDRDKTPRARASLKCKILLRSFFEVFFFKFIRSEKKQDFKFLKNNKEVGFNWSNISFSLFGKERTKNKKEANLLQRRVVVCSRSSASASAAKALVCLSLLRPVVVIVDKAKMTVLHATSLRTTRWKESQCCHFKNDVLGGRKRKHHVHADASKCEQVHSYLHTSPKSTILERAFLERYWTFMVHTFCPKWLAPNLITTLGLCFVILNVSLVLYFSPELDGSSPNWVYAVCAVGFWIYQTMDGMDGKQARRTGTGSPLGEVVDHGCDAFSACAYATILCDAFSFNAKTNRLLVCAITSCGRWNFGLDTVTSTYQGLLPINDFDAQEIQIICQIVFLLTAYLGPSGWKEINVPVPTFVSPSGTIPVGLLFMGVASIVSYTTRFITVVKTVRKRRQVKSGSVATGEGKRRTSTRAQMKKNGGLPPHWPQDRSLAAVYLTVVVIELCFFNAVYHSKNFIAAHICACVMFTEVMVRVMQIRVSDPNFRVFNWTHAIVAYVASQVIEKTDDVGMGTVIAVALATFFYRFFHLVAQVTGCLGLHPNIFVIKKAAGNHKKGKKGH